MLFFNANFICYYFYPTKKREEPFFIGLLTILFPQSFRYLVKNSVSLFHGIRSVLS